MTSSEKLFLKDAVEPESGLSGEAREEEGESIILKPEDEEMKIDDGKSLEEKIERESAVQLKVPPK